MTQILKSPSIAKFSCLLMSLIFVSAALGQSPTIEFQTTRAFVYTTGHDALQPFAITITNPGSENLHNASFTITMPSGVVLGSVDQECTETNFNESKTLSCTIQQVDAGKSHITDFFVDGPLSSAPNGVISMQLSSELSIVEQSAEEASLADGDLTVKGAELTLQLVRDILFDGNSNSISDIDEQILLPTPDQSFEEILTQDAVLDVMFLVSSTGSDYLSGQLDQRIAQLITATNEVFRENQVAIKTRSVDVRDVEYSESLLLEETLTQMQTASVAAFEDLAQSVESTGADLVVLLHAIPPTLDEFCGVSASVGLGRQGDYQADYHRGRLLTVLDVGPACLGLTDLATSFAVNMGIVATREIAADGGTFSYSSGYAVPDAFRTIATRVGKIENLGTAEDVNRFSNPEILCTGLACGIDSDDIAQGANAVLSLNQTRHVISALNSPAIPITDLSTKYTPSFSNGIDVEVDHQAVEAGAFIDAFAEYEITVTNTYTETLHDMNVSAIHLDNGLIDASARTYRYDPQQCSVAGETITTTPVVFESLEEKRGRLMCYIDALPPGESVDISYSLLIDSGPPELAEADNYYHEFIAVNSIPQLESAHCIPVYSDLFDASIGSEVCTVVNDLLLSVDLETGFVDLEEVPSVTGNILSVPFIRINADSLISAIFQIVNVDIGVQELILLSYRELNPSLIPLLQSDYDEVTEQLLIRGMQLDEAVFDLTAELVESSDPVTFNNLILTEAPEI